MRLAEAAGATVEGVKNAARRKGMSSGDGVDAGAMKRVPPGPALIGLGRGRRLLGSGSWRSRVLRRFPWMAKAWSRGLCTAPSLHGGGAARDSEAYLSTGRAPSAHQTGRLGRLSPAAMMSMRARKKGTPPQGPAGIRREGQGVYTYPVKHNRFPLSLRPDS